MSRKTGADRWIVVGLLVLLAALMGVVAQAYEPLTPEQARAYMVRDPAGALRDIIALDLLEHSMPDAVMPERVLSWDGADLVIEYRPAWIDLDVGPLSYRVLLEPERARGFRPRPPPGRGLLYGAIGLGVGLAAGFGLSALLR